MKIISLKHADADLMDPCIKGLYSKCRLWERDLQHKEDTLPKKMATSYRNSERRFAKSV